MEQVLIQIVADDQGAVSLEYLADLVRLLSPEEIVELLTHFRADLDKKLRAGLQVGKLPLWVSQTLNASEVKLRLTPVRRKHPCGLCFWRCSSPSREQ